MHIVLFCATRRGYLFLQKLSELLPGARLTAFSFREEPVEPPFMDDIRQLAESKGGRFLEARQVGAKSLKQYWKKTEADLMFAVSWRYMIPAEIYEKARLGTFVFHDSLLPEYRGFSPTVWAIINGEDHTGVTLFEIAEEVDAGDIIDQERVPIDPNDTIASAMERVTETYLNLLERNLEGLSNGTAPRDPQDHSKATYMRKRVPEDNKIEWNAPTGRIYNLIRALTYPYPGAFTHLSGSKLRIWSAAAIPDNRHYEDIIPGRIAEVRPGEGSVVLTGDGGLLLTEVQKEGGERVCASELLDNLSQTLGD